MGAKTSVRVWRGSRGLTSALVYAILEWLLIFLLFIDALFSYLVTKFATVCELKTPCLFCSRIDHIIGCEKPGFYRNLICRGHKLEISSLAYCRAHEKLGNVHEMCEGCLLSFAIEKKSNAETYRSLVAKLGPDYMCSDGGDQDIHPKLDVSVDYSPIILHGENPVEDSLLKDATLESLGTGHCSCCNRPFSSEQQFHDRLVHFKSIASGMTELLDAASSGHMEHGSPHRRSGLKKRNKKSRGLAAESHSGSHGFDPLSHIGYTELKITSDTESEVSFSDDDAAANNDDGDARACEAGALEDKILDTCVHPEPRSIYQNVLPRSLSADGNAMVCDVGAFDDETSDQCIHPQTGSINQNVHRSLSADGNAMVCEVGAFDDETSDQCIHPRTGSINQNVSPSDLSEEKFIHQAPVLEPSIFVPQERLNANEPLDISSLPSAVSVGHGLKDLNWNQVGESGTAPLTSQIIPLGMLSSSAKSVEAPIEGFGKYVDILKTDTGFISSSESKKVINVESMAASAKTGFNQTLVNEPGPSISSCMDLNEAFQLAIGNKGCQLSDELRTSRESSQIQEDLKVLLSQLSAAQGFELSWNNMSPRVHAHADDLKIAGGSGSIGQQMLHRRISIERNESGFESLDGSIVSEIEGENEVDRLKRQIELDLKSMRTLYKELEEERSASAIAANQAMAMITRLQEEKAAMQMEALQYQRMMEDQAEYDQEALQKLNELLAQREKEIQDLEEELVTSRSQNKSMVEKILRPVTDMKEDCSHLPCSGYENDTYFKGINSADQIHMVNGDYNYVGNKMVSPKDLLIDIEDDKLYITKRLKRLENMLHLFSNNGVHINISELDDRDGHLVMEFDEEDPITLKDNIERNGGFCQSEVRGGMVHLPCNGVAQEINQMGVEEEDFSLQNRSSPYEEYPHAKPSCNPQCITKNKLDENCDGPHSSLTQGDIDFIAMRSEVLHLNERLDTLEADRNFLEHTINSLRHGDGGVQFIREIADHLRELRRIGITRNHLPELRRIGITGKQKHSA